MKPHARERISNAAAAYLEAHAALEHAARNAQTLVDQLIAIAVALTDTGTRLRDDAWKFAAIDELPAMRETGALPGASIRLGKMPPAKALLEAIADWRKKRGYLQQLWDGLPAEARATLKPPQTLD